MAAGLDNKFDPAVTPEASDNIILTEVRRIIKMADGEPNLLTSRYDPDFLTMEYDGHEFAHYFVHDDQKMWISFRMVPALKKKYAVDPRFEHIEDKDKEYWRIDLKSPEDVTEYKDLIIEETL